MKQFMESWGIEIVLFAVGIALAYFEVPSLKDIVWAFFFPAVFRLLMKLTRGCT